MNRLMRHTRSCYLQAKPSAWSSNCFPSSVPPFRARYLATQASNSLFVPQLTAPDLGYAKDLAHLGDVASHLEEHGILKISLQFPDTSSSYLHQLLLGLHEHQGHQLPISHSAGRGWFWDVRPSSTTSDFQSGSDHQARSETMGEFPWHTDCSYEDPPPRYFALQVLQHDRRGGGTLSVMDVERLSTELLSPGTRSVLAEPQFRLNIPPEFIKDPCRRSIVGSLLATATAANGTTTPTAAAAHHHRNHSQAPATMRFRGDIITPLTEGASGALAELDDALRRGGKQSRYTMHLSSQDMPTGTVLLVDNRRWLHARNEVRDAERHLRRVRWDAISF